jgi:hypothetical protein
MGLRHNPITYLFLSNALLWGLPLSINHWHASRHNRDVDSAQVASQTATDGQGTALVSPPLISTADPLLSVNPLHNTNPMLSSTTGAGIESTGRGFSSPGLGATALGGDPSKTPPIISVQMQFGLETTSARRPSSDLLGQLRGADGLGGPITLASLDEPVVPIAARAEQLQWQRSNDALAALPLHWRDPLRKELGNRVRVSQAATVRLPVRDLAERQELPVIITDQGVAEGLVKPKNSQTRQAVENWAARQRPAQAGTVQVMVVAAEPVEAPAADGVAEVASLPVSEAKSEPAAPPQLPPLPEPQL